MSIDKKSKKSGHRRWLANRKMEVVVRYLKGESIYDLSREIGEVASETEQWHLKALHGINDSLKSREGNPAKKEFDRAKKRIGEFSMEVELLREKRRHNRAFWGGRC